MEYLVWTLVVLLMLIGVVGSVVPILPGTTLILIAALVQKWLLPETLSWTALAWVAVFWVLSVIADIGCTILGTRWFGGSKWGMAGATGGALGGMFFSLPALIVATILGAFVAEKWLGKRSTEDSLKAGAGAAIGFLVSTVAKVFCAVAMIACYIVSVMNHAS
ncbi:DUF456 domain-containing protein [Oleiharenicola lentus]|uniref:DUF456 domain-containing protein n=1 Tax=Oleiharenicola lentus TaxID=2508720 RepID=UPI003F680AF0